MRMTKFVGGAAISFAVFASIPVAAAQQQAPPTRICSGQALCHEETDFAAVITTFRVSTNNIYKQKIIDVTVRFENKTTQAVVLGYVDHSGLATDDRGNRSIPWGPNAYRGIGLVAGTTFDPKLVLRPGGWGDAQFELVQQGTPQVTGNTYALDLTIDEINNSGGQPALGGEFPLHFDGLVNGASGSAASLTNLAGAPCGAQGAGNKASDTANAISSLSSIFGKKKTAQTAGQVAAAAAGCDSATTTASSTGAVSAPVAGDAGQRPAASSAAGTSAPQTSRAPAASAAPQSVSSNTNKASAQSAEPWSPPTDAAAEKAGLADPLKLPEVTKMPDVVGVRLGMTEQQAVQILRGQYPKGRFQEIPANGIFPTNPKADYGFNILPTDVIATDAVVSLTAPPGPQVVWRVVRFTRRIHANHVNVLAALRQKYGKESLAGLANGTITTDERSIGMLLWVFDEHGGRLPMPSAQAFGSGSLNAIPCGAGPGSGGVLSDVGPRIPMEETKSQDWCSSVVAIVVTIDPTEIVENTVTNMVDMKLAGRTANAYVAWKRDADARARAAELEKSKKNKPVF